MEKNNNYIATSIRNLIAFGDDKNKGIPKLEEIIATYSCPLNAEIERFLKCSAIEFTKRNQSITYLVLSNCDDALIGYFALAVKVLSVRAGTVSNTTWKKLLRTGEVDEERGVITTPAYLIAQLGKNYTDGFDAQITGSDLLRIACDKVMEARRIVGGVAVFVEAEDKAELAQFYHENGFARFEVRASSVDDKLVQYLRVL